jgi:hypothetical protein
MAIVAAAVSVTTTANGTLVSGGPTGGAGRHGVCLRVPSGTIYLGGFGVTSAAGFPWSDADGAFPITTSDRLYAITASGTVEVRVLTDED